MEIDGTDSERDGITAPTIRVATPPCPVAGGCLASVYMAIVDLSFVAVLKSAYANMPSAAKTRVNLMFTALSDAIRLRILTLVAAPHAF